LCPEHKAAAGEGTSKERKRTTVAPAIARATILIISLSLLGGTGEVRSVCIPIFRDERERARLLIARGV